MSSHTAYGFNYARLVAKLEAERKKREDEPTEVTQLVETLHRAAQKSKAATEKVTATAVDIEQAAKKSRDSDKPLARVTLKPEKP